MEEKVFGLFKNNVCENTVVAEAKDILEIMLGNDYVVVEPNDEWPIISIGDELFNNKIRSSKPFPSWTFNEDAWSWQAPSPQPANTENETYIWDEESLSWIVA